jgi:SAM-dependent methyltransferase
MKLPDEIFGAGSFLMGHAWNLYARVYDATHPRLVDLVGAFGEFSYDEFEEEFVNLADLKPGSTVLDVACGTGAALPALSLAVGDDGEILGVDISSKMLDKAEQRAEQFDIDNASFREADVEKLSLEFDEESFDAVLCCNGLPNFLRPHRAIVEMTHVLREGGRLALSTLNRDKCEENPLFFVGMRFPRGRFPYKQEFRDVLEDLGFGRIKLRERGLMLIIIADKGSTEKGGSTQTPSAKPKRRPRKISPDNL